MRYGYSCASCYIELGGLVRILHPCEQGARASPAYKLDHAIFTQSQGVLGASRWANVGALVPLGFALMCISFGFFLLHSFEACLFVIFPTFYTDLLPRIVSGGPYPTPKFQAASKHTTGWRGIVSAQVLHETASTMSDSQAQNSAEDEKPAVLIIGGLGISLLRSNTKEVIQFTNEALSIRLHRPISSTPHSEI